MQSSTSSKGSSPALLKRVFNAAVDIAIPANYLAKLLPSRPKGKLLVVAAGKGAKLMADEFAKSWSGEFEGIAITLAAGAGRSKKFSWQQAGHPVPTKASVAAASKVASAAAKLGKDDLLILLLSGGASSMLCLPAANITLAAKQKVYQQLLNSGADIAQINTVRRAISAIKGGRLAVLANPARTYTIAASDVIGDVAEDIASGPTVVSSTRNLVANQIIQHYKIKLPTAVQSHLKGISTGNWPTARKLARSKFVLAISPKLALEAAGKTLKKEGYRVINLGAHLAGEATQVAETLAGIAKAVVADGNPLAPPVAIISGGELTVTGAGTGRGGPNCEFALACGLQLANLPKAVVFAADTDGIDGSANAAGAIIDCRTLADLKTRSNAVKVLQNHASASFLQSHRMLFKSGQTGVNVNDLRVLLLPE